LQAIPTIVADNAGLDSAELISQLQAKHHKENSITGIDVITGSVSSQTSIVFSHYIYAYEISIRGEGFHFIIYTANETS
jgi:hypothetical protein